MKKSESTPAVATAKKIDSRTESVFDTVTVWTVKGLNVAKKSLERSARWLDGTAQQAGELAAKLTQRA